MSVQFFGTMMLAKDKLTGWEIRDCIFGRNREDIVGDSMKLRLRLDANLVVDFCWDILIGMAVISTWSRPQLSTQEEVDVLLAIEQPIISYLIGGVTTILQNQTVGTFAVKSKKGN